jgi:hypothetical protein
MQPLAQALDVSQFGTASQHAETIRRNIGRKLPELSPAFCSHDGTVVLVGSGPSLSAHVEDIKQEREKGRPIVAIKGAHDYLCEHGVIPDVFVSLEPRDRSHRDLKHKNDTTVYLLASRVAPETFDHLKDMNVLIWHSFGSDEEKDSLQRCGVKLAIGGGPTSGLRALNIFYMQGYRNFVMYGFDSCIAEDGRKRVDGSMTGQTIDVIVGGKRFVCNYAMADQAQAFEKATYNCLPGIHIEVKGGGLLAAIIEERKKKGKPT